MRALLTKHHRWEWRRTVRTARKTGWQGNDTRIRCLWRDEGSVSQRTSASSRCTVSAFASVRRARPGVLWVFDFRLEITVDGRTLKLQNVIDELTRECLAIDVDRSIDVGHVVRVFDRLATERGRARALSASNEARVSIEEWRIGYNINRPHTARGEPSRPEFAAAWTINPP